MSEKNSPVALITGSGRPRVGNVVARFLATRGYRVALHYHRSKEPAEQTREQLRAEGVDCEAFQANVAKAAEVERMVRETVDRFGRLDVLVTTASIWAETPLDEVTEEDLRRNFEVNAAGTFFAARAAGQQMVQQSEGGVIVTIGDWAIDRPELDHAAYYLSKGAIPTLTRMLAVELGCRNPKVRVNCIHPGPVMFPPDATDQRKQRLREATLIDGADTPEAVAWAVEGFINNPFVTGACLPVDGGRHCYSPEEG